MTNTTTVSEEVFKVDARGRVQTQRARREELLDEFERSGASGQAFAKMVGVKYQTFASWVQKRRRVRQPYPAASTLKTLPSTATDALRLVEAVVERGDDQGAIMTAGPGLCVHPRRRGRCRAATWTIMTAGPGLCVHLPGGARMEVHDARQAVLAAELLKALAAARPC